MLARELVEKYNIDISQLSNPEYAAEVEKRIADTSWAYAIHRGQYILYDASQYKLKILYGSEELRALEGVAERGEVYHTILGAKRLPWLFDGLYKYGADENTHLVLKFEDGFANNFEHSIKMFSMNTTASIWLDLSNVLTINLEDKMFGASSKVKIWDVNDYLMDSLVFNWHFNSVLTSDITRRKVIDFVNKRLAQETKIHYKVANNIALLVGKRYLDIYKKLEFTNISEPSISKLCNLFSCSVEEVSRLSNRGANFTKSLRFNSSVGQDLSDLANLFNKYNGIIYFSNITISGGADFRKFLPTNCLCFEKCKWRGFNFDTLLSSKVKYPIEIYSFDDNCSWSEQWFSQELKKEVLFKVQAVNSNSRQGELSSILKTVNNRRGIYLRTSEENEIILSYLIYGSSYMSRVSELREELRKLLSEVRVTHTPPVVIPSISSVNDIPSYGTVVSVSSIKELSPEDKKVLTGVMKSSLGVMLSISSSVESRYTIGEVRQILLDKGYPRSLVNESIVSYLADLRLAR